MPERNERMDSLPVSELEQSLADFYGAVSKAQAIGFFRGHHGPLEETAWVHVAIHHLEDIERLASAVINGDVQPLVRIRSLLTNSSAPSKTFSYDPATSGHRVVGHAMGARRPVAVGVAAALLDRLDERTGFRWIDRANAYYGSRMIAVQQALAAAADVHGRSLSLARFAEVVRLSNPLAVPDMEHGEGLPSQMPMDHTPEDWGHPRATNQTGHVLHAASSPELEGIFQPIVAIAVSTTSVPDLLNGVSDLLPADRALVDHMRELATNWSSVSPQWQRVLSRQEPAAQVGGSDERNRPSRNRCVPGHPEGGGLWEIARIAVTETDKYCLPAQALQDESSRAYAGAGAELIKAQNEWIKTKECFGDANNERKNCIKEQDQSYSKCTEERDEGYDACAREEDRGHSGCCDWWPCSWLCDAWVWFKNIVCVVWEWISNIVCVVWAWIKKVVCVAWAYIKAIGCAILHVVSGLVHLAEGIAGIGIGIALRSAVRFVSAICDAFGSGPVTRTTSAFKVVGVHAAVLHTNKVMLFAYDEGVHPVSASNPADFTAIGDSDRALCALWDPASATGRYVTIERNLFCAHQSFTADGKLFVAGGQFPLPGLLKSLVPPELLAPGADKDVHVFDPSTETWRRLPDMQKGRWYPTCVTLPNGMVFTASGTNGYATEAGFGRGIQDTWQIADPTSGVVSRRGDFGFHLYHLYPFMHVLPSGTVFVHFKRTTVLFDPGAENPLVRVAAGGVDSHHTGSTKHPYSRTGPGPGTCVLLPLIPELDSKTGAVIYPKGRLMILGGGGAEKEPEPADPTDDEPRSDGTTGYNLHSDTAATSSSEILDFAEADPQWRFTNEFMQSGRVMPDSVLLPTGKVLVVGGGRAGQSGGLLAHFTSTDTHGEPDKGATDPVLEPELFDPQTETWEQLCPKPIARLYHTTAVLLPDARVLVAGHDGALNMPPFDSSQYQLELFSPPYLFASGGALASRPVIGSAPDSATLGQRFQIVIIGASDIASVALIRQSSVTHQINSDQRYVGLLIVERSEDQITVQMPQTGGVAPPGFYMLFIVNRAGVPSAAHWMRVAMAT